MKDNKMSNTKYMQGDYVQDYAGRTITIKGVAEFITCYENHSSYFYEDVKPIPLTPEQLVRLGFVRGGEDNKHPVNNRWFYRKDLPIYVNPELGYIELDKDYRFPCIYQYVHELQHFCHINFKTELKYEI